MIGPWLKTQSAEVRALLRPEMGIVEVLFTLVENKLTKEVATLDSWIRDSLVHKWAPLTEKKLEIRSPVGRPEVMRRVVHKGEVVGVFAMTEKATEADVARFFREAADSFEELAGAVRESADIAEGVPRRVH